MLEFNLSTTSKRVVLAGELAKYGPDQTHRVSVQQAQAYCSRWATAHPENFIVASILLPRSLKQDFHNIYAYCRWSDDLADETGAPQAAVLLLDWWQCELEQSLSSPPRHPILLALRQTIQRHNLDLDPFLQLLSAFRQDQHTLRYTDDAQLLDYCRRSANPVGRILLQLARAVTPASLALSDAICTGLQLANFCQDMSRDADCGRIYLPRSRWQTHGVDEAMLLRRQVTPELRQTLAHWVDATRRSLRQGWPLVRLVPSWLRTDIDLFVRGGLAILQAIESQQFDVWTERPRLTKTTQAKLLLTSLLISSTPPPLHKTSPHISSPPAQSGKNPITSKLNHRGHAARELRYSRRWCARICRQSKSSFYNSFALLDEPRRQAMRALYAFARITDDLADNPQPAELRAAQLEHWRIQLWQHCHIQDIASSDDKLSLDSNSIAPSRVPLAAPDNFDAIWPALADCVAKYQIPIKLLDEIVTGVLMDVDHHQPTDWDELQNYCYHVAATVGLACTHIWHAEERGSLPIQATIECGIAFQLTNILRDIGQDARAQRIYIPQSLFEQYSVDRSAWLSSQPTGDWQSMLEDVAHRAQQLYRTGWPTVHTLTPRSQRMFSLMWHSYRNLLPYLMANKEQLWTTKKLHLPKSKQLRMLAQHAVAPSRLLIR